MNASKATNAQYWHARAEEARVMAERMQSETARDEMMDIAKGYDQLADNAEEFVRLFSGLTINRENSQ